MKTLIAALSLLGAQAQAGTFLAQFGAPLSKAEQQVLARSPGVQSIRLFDSYPSDYYRGLYEIEAQSEASVKALAGVKSVEIPFVIEGLSLIPLAGAGPTNDMFSHQQWALGNRGQDILEGLTDIDSQLVKGVPGADIGLGAYGVLEKQMKRAPVVAVLDYGMDYEHPELKDSIAKNLPECNQEGLVRFPTTGDLDGNGYAGDCMGWDFTEGKDGGPRPIDDHGHGTHVAGIIAAKAGNGIGVAGVASSIKILPIKVLRKVEGTGGNPAQSLSHRVAKGILYALKMKADVINMSLGWPHNMDGPHIREAVLEAHKQGVVVVAAAGNNSSDLPIYPCAYPEVLCVGATRVDDSMANFSNHGAHVDILAPGEKILSTYPTTMETPFRPNGYKIMNGTSQSAPYVSAAAALLKGLHPEWSELEVRGHLLSGQRDHQNDRLSLTRNLDIQKALASDLAGVVLPTFKDAPYVVLSPDGTGTLELALQSYSPVDASVSIALGTGRAQGVEVVSGPVSAALLPYQKAPLRFVLKAHDLNLSSRTLLTLNVGARSYPFWISVARKLDIAAQESTTYGFDPSIKPTTIAIKNGADFMVRMRTVIQRFPGKGAPEYYTAQAARQGATGMDLTILRAKGRTFFPTLINLPLVTELTTFMKLDVDADGSEDYFMQALAVKEGESEKKFLRYFYFRADGTSIAGPFDYYPKYAVPNERQYAFRYQAFGKGKLAFPAFYTEGQLPIQDQVTSVWEDPDYSAGGHLYTFKLVPGKKELELRALDDHHFRTALKKKFNLAWYQDIEVDGILFQNQAAFAANKLAFHVKIGRGGEKTYYQVTFTDNKWSILAMHDANRPLEGHMRTPIVTIQDGKVDPMGSTALSAPLLDNFLQFMALDPKQPTKVLASMGHKRERAQDSILGMTASFLDEARLWAVFETKGNLSIQVSETGAADVRKFLWPIHRVSFLAGHQFSEMFFPMAVGDVTDRRPGLYIDATRINTGHIYVVDMKENGPSSRVVNNVFIPAGCQAMNPVLLEGRQHFALVCSVGQGPNAPIKLLFEPIQ